MFFRFCLIRVRRSAAETGATPGNKYGLGSRVRAAGICRSAGKALKAADAERSGGLPASAFELTTPVSWGNREKRSEVHRGLQVKGTRLTAIALRLRFIAVISGDTTVHKNF